MRLLPDESSPNRLSREFAQDEVRTVQQAGWSGLQGGLLLRAAEREFDVFVTVDQGLRFQQKIPGFAIAIVVLEARSPEV